MAEENGNRTEGPQKASSDSAARKGTPRGVKNGCHSETDRPDPAVALAQRLRKASEERGGSSRPVRRVMPTVPLSEVGGLPPLSEVVPPATAEAHLESPASHADLASVDTVTPTSITDPAPRTEAVSHPDPNTESHVKARTPTVDRPPEGHFTSVASLRERLQKARAHRNDQVAISKEDEKEDRLPSFLRELTPEEAAALPDVPRPELLPDDSPESSFNGEHSGELGKRIRAYASSIVGARGAVARSIVSARNHIGSFGRDLPTSVRARFGRRGVFSTGLDLAPAEHESDNIVMLDKVVDKVYEPAWSIDPESDEGRRRIHHFDSAPPDVCPSNCGMYYLNDDEELIPILNIEPPIGEEIRPN